jgi:hypothetical protein
MSVVGEVTEWEPPRVVRYTFGDERSYLRFELCRDGDGTRLHFTQSFAEDEGTDASEDDAYPGADRPAGPDSPWRPGFVAGFHLMLDELDSTCGASGPMQIGLATSQHRLRVPNLTTCAWSTSTAITSARMPRL